MHGLGFPCEKTIYIVTYVTNVSISIDIGKCLMLYRIVTGNILLVTPLSISVS